MNGDELHGFARSRALELPGTSAGWPFGPNHEVMKVRERVFLMLTIVPAASSGYGVDDTPARPAVHHPQGGTGGRGGAAAGSTLDPPGYHMNKRHWVSVATGASIDADLVRELVTDSYRLVVESLPRRARPFDWDAPDPASTARSSDTSTIDRGPVAGSDSSTARRWIRRS